MTDPSSKSASRSILRSRFAIIFAAFIGAAILLLPRYVPDYAPGSSETPESGATEDRATKITRLADASDSRNSLRDSSRGKIAKSGKATSATSATRAPDSLSTDKVTTEPLRQEAYLSALMAMMEKDGKDNALIHYALAVELAPPLPNSEQGRLIQLVIDEGWDERAEPLLPYLLAWQAAFEKLHQGASLKYARGVGFELGENSPGPNYLGIREATKMLAVYGRYLESQGRGAAALQQLQTVLSIGRDFNSADNMLITNLIGVATENVGLRQLSQMVSSNVLSPSELADVLDHLQYVEQGQSNVQSAIDGEMQVMINVLRKYIESPEVSDELIAQNTAANSLDAIPIERYEEEYRKVWAAASEYFNTPYWERDPDASFMEAVKTVSTLSMALPNYDDAEVRLMFVISKLRKQQIDVAVQRYVADHQEQPPGIDTLVNLNYLPANPVDPFSGKPFTYIPDNDGYQLYGSGPNRSFY